MVKGAAAGPGVYSATYSNVSFCILPYYPCVRWCLLCEGPAVLGATWSDTLLTHHQIPVWEYQFGVDLKEHVMRRRYDDYINATHILKAAGFDKPARTRILEREVQKGEHEKVQGGYGKYQGEQT